MKSPVVLPCETVADLGRAPDPDTPEYPVFRRHATLTGLDPQQAIARGQERVAAVEEAERAASDAIARADSEERDAGDTAARHRAEADRHDAEERKERDAADLAPPRRTAREHDEAANGAAAKAAGERAAAEAVEADAIAARAAAHDAVAAAAKAQISALGWFLDAAPGWFAIAQWRQRNRATEAVAAAQRLLPGSET